MSDKFPGGFLTAGAPAGFSVAFDGTGDYLSMSSGTSLGAGNFTIECWVYLTAAPAGETTVGSSSDYYTAGFNGNFVFRVGTQNLWRSFDAQSNQATIDGTFTWATGQWYHMAWVRNSGTVTVYRNGVSLGSVADSKTLSDSANGYAIAATKSSGSYSSLLTGYISNLRVVVGTALYTTTFTPPTQLLNISGTSFLTCNSPTIIDQSTNAYTITTVGDSKVSNFTPFAGYTGFNPALGAAAGGVWTLDEAAYYQNNRQWPIYDPYFNQTTLMLHGNGTNGAQNNTFLDSSTNNFTITRNGNTTQGAFTPFSQTGWSTYFLRSNTDYLGLPNGSVATGSNDFSIEAFVYPLDRASSYAVFGGNTDRATAGGSSITVTLTSTNGYIEFTGWFGGSAVNLYSPTLPINTWTHFVICRTGTTIGMFVNGVRVSTVACSGSINAGSSANNPSIGSNGTGSADNFTGYISNFRMIIGSGVYSALNTSYTVPTSPLTVVTNTKVLACQSNRYVDNSANNYTITANGTPSVQAFSPFVPAYITPTTYSNYFDGSTGYLSFPSSANFTFGTGDYTVEAWVNLNSSSTYQTMFGSSTTDALMFNIYSMNSVVIQTAGSNIFATFSGATFATNTWYHVAVSRSSGTVKAFVNGVQYGSTITSNTTNYALPTTNTIGANAASQYFGGCLSNLRIVKGGALYTSNFTPSTEPLTTTVSAGTVSLLTCQNSTFIDNSTNNLTLTAAGTVKPVTSPTPFPAKVDTTTLNSAYSTSLIGGSAYFDGSSDYLNFTGNANTSIGGNDWTVEAWVYCTSFSQQYQQILRGETSNIILLMLETTAKRIQCEIGGGSSAFSPTTLQLNTWTHCAAVRSGSNVTVYINGVGGTPVTMNPTTTTTEVFRVGTDTSLARWLNGYVCGLRMVKGTALYTQNFAPPTLPPTAVTNTQLLLNYTNGAIFDNTAKNVLETVGNAQISTTQSKWGGSSMYFDGTGDYLLYRSNALSSISGDFTVEGWIYPVSWGSNSIIIGQTSSSQIGRYGSSGTAFGIVIAGGWVITDAALPSTSVWTHFAVVRQNGVVKIYINGTQSGSSASNTGILSMNCVGSASGSGDYNGYIDDLRVTNCARYLTNFTPPTSQLQDQ